MLVFINSGGNRAWNFMKSHAIVKTATGEFWITTIEFNSVGKSSSATFLTFLNPHTKLWRFHFVCNAAPWNTITCHELVPCNKFNKRILLNKVDRVQLKLRDLCWWQLLFIFLFFLIHFSMFENPHFTLHFTSFISYPFFNQIFFKFSQHFLTSSGAPRFMGTFNFFTTARALKRP